MYIQIKRENSESPDFYEKEEMVKSSWEIFQTEYSLVCSIIRKSDNCFIGYVSIKDTRVNLWEIAIELLQEHCNKGYGTRAIPLLVNEVSRITSKKQFQALVETDNLPSQLLMEKIGAKLIDIYDYSFYGDEEAANAFEEKHLEEITERMIALAKWIDVESRKMLSHVLDYRIYADI